MAKAALASPNKQSSSNRHLKELQPTIYADDQQHDPVATSEAKMGWAELQAMAEDYELEAASHLRLLQTSLTSRLSTLARHCDDVLASLDDRVKSLSLSTFVHQFQADPDHALTALVREEMGEVEMGEGERGARKRKRVLPLSPRAGGSVDDLSASTSKKPRNNASSISATLASAKKKPVPGSVGAKSSMSLGRSTRGAAGGPGGSGTSPASSRKPPRATSAGLRLRPSTSTSNQGNFIYRASPTSASTSTSTTNVLPTLSTSSKIRGAGTARRPKRGESIVMRSVNGSPLGEYVASDLEEEEEEDEEDEEEDWDVLEANEASRTERNTLASNMRSPTKKKLQKPSRSGSKSTLPTSTSTSSVPSAPSFAPALGLGGASGGGGGGEGVVGADAGGGVPSWASLREEFVKKMQRELEGMGMEEGERRRVEEAMRRSVMGV